MITTSRYSSRKTREFAKKLAAEGAESYVARGKKTIDQIAAFARKKGEESIRVIEEKEDLPHKIVLISVSETGLWKWNGEKLLTA
jgi:rRNA maturation protein Rpf1